MTDFKSIVSAARLNAPTTSMPGLDQSHSASAGLTLNPNLSADDTFGTERDFMVATPVMHSPASCPDGGFFSPGIASALGNMGFRDHNRHNELELQQQQHSHAHTDVPMYQERQAAVMGQSEPSSDDDRRRHKPRGHRRGSLHDANDDEEASATYNGADDYNESESKASMEKLVHRGGDKYLWHCSSCQLYGSFCLLIGICMGFLMAYYAVFKHHC